MHTVFYMFYVWFNKTFSNDLEVQNLSFTKAIRSSLMQDTTLLYYKYILAIGYSCDFCCMELSGKN